MTRTMPPILQERRRLSFADRPLRLDLLSNPYGSSLLVQESLASRDDLHLQDYAGERRLKERLAARSKVPVEWIVLANGADEAIWMCLLAQREQGPVVLFPPTDRSPERMAELAGTEIILAPRAQRLAVEIDAGVAVPFPKSSLAIVQSPNDPTGIPLGAPDAVRLSRRCQTLVIDERHGEYGARSMLPLVREFDNIAVLQSFEMWAGLAGLPIAYMIARPPLVRRLEAFRPAARISAAAVVAGNATLDDIAYVEATVRRVRDEKSSMYRQLRKLNMLRPLQSWANFQLVQIERGTAPQIQQELAARDIFVYRPTDELLDHHLRIAAATPEATRLLKESLIDISTGLN